MVTSPIDPITLATIEPVATSGLAVTLAYLALDRFRYRRSIEELAAQCHVKYSSDELLVAEENLGPWQEVVWLSRESKNGFKPSGFWGSLYKAIFRHHIDFLLITVLALLSGGALAIGVARSLHTWAWFEWTDSRTGAVLFFYICLIATGLPFLAMYGGHRCSIWGVRRVKYCDEQLLIYQRRQAIQVQPPGADELT